MKLFDALFKILIEQNKKLILGGDLEIFTIVSQGKPSEIHYYLDFEFNSNKSYASERHNPLRGQIEEHLAKIILDDDPRSSEIANFLNENLGGDDNPLEGGKSIVEVLKKDHPETVRKVIAYGTNAALLNGAADLVIEVLKAPYGGNYKKLGRGDKETYEEFWYEKNDNLFHYEEGETPAIGSPNLEKTFTEQEFKAFLKNNWIRIKDGFVTGKGQITSMSYWLEERGCESIRDYIEMKKSK